MDLPKMQDQGPDRGATDSSPYPALVKLLKRAEIDRALLTALVLKGWNFLAAPLTLFLIAARMKPVVQGFYFTFGSLIALQNFVDLGFCIVITQFASHEWSKLHLEKGRIAGDPHALSRLSSLFRLSLKWYGVASGIFWIAASIGGYLFFRRQAPPTVSWIGPWFSVVALTACQLWIDPVIAVLEGCNQVAGMYRVRLARNMAGTIALWLVLVHHGELWISPAYVGAGLVSSMIVLVCEHRRMLRSLLSTVASNCISWSREIWPLQWRVAGSGLAGYFLFSLFTPVMFHFQGPIVAGQMGMTLQICAALQSIASVWITTKVPLFGVLIAKRQFVELDALFRRVFTASMSVATGAAACSFAGLWFLNFVHHPFAARALPLLPSALFLIGSSAGQISQCLGYYLIAHKQNPMLPMNIVTGILNGCLVVFAGRCWGALGAAVVNLVVIAGLMIPWHVKIWLRCRSEWHGPSDFVLGDNNGIARAAS